MYENFQHHVGTKISLSTEEFDKALRFFHLRRLNRKEFFLREGDSVVYHAFVERGALKSYTINEKGREHISAFAFEGYWVTDIRSFCSGNPSRFCIDALEPTEVLQITLEASESLCETIPAFERYFRILYQRSIGNLSYKLDDSFQLTAAERYRRLVKEHPDILNRVPQYLIASFLGITPESLSRLRNIATK